MEKKEEEKLKVTVESIEMLHWALRFGYNRCVYWKKQALKKKRRQCHWFPYAAKRQ